MVEPIKRRREIEEQSGALALQEMQTQKQVQIPQISLQNSAVTNCIAHIPAVSKNRTSLVSKNIEELPQIPSILQSALYKQTIDKIEKGIPPNSDPNKLSIEQHFHTLMLLLMKESKSLLVLHRNLLQIEKEWKNSVFERLQETNTSLQKTQSIRGHTANLSRYFGPFSLLATGSIALGTSIIATGGITGISVLAIAATVVGGLLLADSVLDDAAKKILAQWLAKATNESEEAWIGRVHLATSLLSVGVGFGISPNQVVQVALTVSNVALQAIHAGVDIQESSRRSFLKEIELELQTSERMLDRHTDALFTVSDTMKTYSKSLMDMHKSLRSTSSLIRI